MKSWRDLLLQLGLEADAAADALTQRLSAGAPVRIAAYRGHGTPQTIYLKGRVLAGGTLALPGDAADSPWQNLLAIYRRFDTTEVAGARVQIEVGGNSLELLTDEEGYFDAALHLAHPLRLAPGVHQVALTITASHSSHGVATAQAHVILPPADADFGMISDIDDTILQTDVPNLLHAAANTLLGNAHTRLPFPGVAQFYQALQAGPSGVQQNPVFYVSGSPWNLYDLLDDFMALNGVPAGPIFLADFGLNADTFIMPNLRRFKLAQIAHIIGVHADLPFILIGDSGQHDPEIYAEVAATYPGRIRAVYIRDVSADGRDTEVEALATDLNDAGVPLLFASDTSSAMSDARQRGLIAAN